MRRHDDLSTPRRGLRVGVHYDPDAFGRFSESIARFIGTARFLVLQTGVVIVWIVVNASVPGLRFDEYPFILLTLALSLQAAYAAPLILLAQGRQESRDREQAEQDRDQSARTLADTDFLARELTSIRLALSDVVTNNDLERAIERALERALERARAAPDERSGPQ
ncbi:MAG: DUF1003 domain-containing protein [Acidimicrobiales bacterium]